ncbi:Ig-like domain-containing protein [Clostridium botulinum]|uniref:Ig-like domain-containing protein n=1 Tax=Clostridium botulinum TaxID=1491 RepID=A0A6B4NAY2_CLOBO|nr:Ig-like domain-containing protein [Clostridium botulinum]EES50080.1 Ig group 2 domain protein [Clostridium botulinum E1 str. 'BoNT E Beluga']MBY6760585.1 Ig-like domain-containing protein [Clostridium botulinum]MBY6919492.1 Ig-like domain-containing protein [Clostridium botulinum]MCR1130371.1 Ig-like domain-containing protein [Clostridium botulinum]NFJ56875.1 Ig-like domain-containing protein [Clostridium botulinum]
MKNCYKRILIMFVMVLTIIGIGAFQNGTIANAAVGQQFFQPEDSWRRFDDRDKKIKYEGTWSLNNGFTSEEYLNCNTHAIGNQSNENKITFYFYGTKVRLLSNINPTRTGYFDIYLDDKLIGRYNQYNDISKYFSVYFEKTNLSKTIHKISIENIDYNTNGNLLYVFDTLDIDEDGYLIDINDISTTLDKTSLTLKEGNSKTITATTTPSAVDVEWSSDDEAIATVDSNGKVTGIKEGTCTVTAQIKGTDVKATCEVTVTKEDLKPEDPEEPSIENGSLYIEMIDGNIKRADKSQIEKFKKWFISRDLDETESPIFKITNAKGNAEYLVHDKVVGFEIRE